QGSAQVAIAPDGTVTRDAYSPYGVTRGTDPLDTERGWLGQVEDDTTGLTYLNARYYDPAVGRFLSPNPLMSPGDPRTLDPYRYADNNPVSYTDASGLKPDCGATIACQAFHQAGNVHDVVQGVHHPPARPSEHGGHATGGQLLDDNAPPGSSASASCVRRACIGAHSHANSDDAMQWFDNVTTTVASFWEDHGDKVMIGAGVVAAGVCIAVSFGTCAVVTAVVVSVTIADGLAYRDWSAEQAVGYGTISALTLGVGGAGMGSLTYRGMAPELVDDAWRFATTWGTQVTQVGRVQYSGLVSTTNLPGTYFAGMGGAG
ncbi:RHS repeat-associated core domain-containing protein, partial [Demequina activiva]|uniref:RHS repeat-associated core domain-containing protein n=1 Tax=Demequina activiva TaxID=1582364 RepID=UPI001941DA65